MKRNGYTRREALKSIGMATAALARFVQAEPTKTGRPNILFIVSEDNGQELSCYGDPNVRTPNLDSLAKEGVMFRDAYVTQAVCSPSRSTFFTGLYPHQNGQLGLATHQYAMFKDFGTSYQRLKKAGYATGMLGKTHVNPEQYVEKWIDYRAIKGSNFAKKNLGEYAEHARTFIEGAGDKPFFLTVNFPDTHWPLQNQVQGRPMRPLSPGEVKPMPYIGVDNARIRKHIAGYYNCMQRLDGCVGELLAVLKESGKMDNTLIVYIGDHGAQMARAKVGVWEGSTRIPFIVRWKGVTNAGAVSKAMVSTIDLLPTFLDAAGLQIPAHLPGKSLRPLLSGNLRPDRFRDYLFTERNCDSVNHYYPQRTVRDRRFKLILTLLPERTDPAGEFYIGHKREHYRGSPNAEELKTCPDRVRRAYATYLRPPAVQLYDLANDPWEFENLAGRSKYAAVQQRLYDRLIKWQAETEDPLADPALLKKLTDEHDALSSTNRRSTEGGWKYLQYLHPDRLRRG